MKKPVIAVAVSGGVDSSVAAALLQEQGFEIFGITMRHYDNKLYGFAPNEGIEASIIDAKAVCNSLGIKHYTVDVSHDFKEIVEQNFINEYRNGRTPNPCTLCNPTIKWGTLLKAAEKLGANKIATGHYIKLMQENDIFNLYCAEDKIKDQSYMLWQLNQEQLSKTLFPLADLTKTRIREIAAKLKLPVHDKQDSQEICFIKGHYEDYLRRFIPFKQGDIVLPDGKIIGKHRGLQLYTIGQRKGLNTPWSSPLYVLRLDIVKNRLVVTDNPDDLLQENFIIDNVNWLKGSRPVSLDNLSVKIRYNSSAADIAELEFYKAGQIKIRLYQPARAITPGQSAVIYKSNQLLGGGIIQ